MFDYCNKVIDYASCSSTPPYLYGQSSLKVGYSTSAPCQHEAGTCSGTVGVKAALGRLSAGASIGTDNTGSVLNSGQDTYFKDQITVTSSTLPSGTPVMIKEIVDLTGSSSQQNSSLQVYGNYSVTSGLSFVCCPILSGKMPITPAKGTLKFSSSVGATFTLAPDLNNSNGIEYGPNSMMVQTTAVFHLKSLTPNVTLVSASGTTY